MQWIMWYRGRCDDVSGTPQLNVKRARKAREGEYNPADYLPVSSKDIEVMYKELLGFVAKSERSVSFKASEKSFCRDVEFAKAFKFSSAAKTVHHGFVGGLLEHTLSSDETLQNIM